MKFITSTHLKQWADTRECQSLLPELIRRLICASVKQLDRLSFPCGDAVHMPGWDGIVFSPEPIDMVPEGESLWECGVNKDIQTKANDDIIKRAANPLGHIKSDSTFVFVTPREWTGADAWIAANQSGWKKLVVYTAVELEVWIEKCPAVGVWLAEKLNVLNAGGYQLPDVFWMQWASGDKYTLPYQIVTAGRNQAMDKVLEACLNPTILEIEALTQSEALAFVIASIATCCNADKLTAKTIIVTDKNTFDDLVSHYENIIIITTLRDNVSYALSKNHTVICAVTPEDQVSTAEKLPRVERESFVKAIEECGFDSAQARKIATDTARDLNVVRRRLKIDKLKPEWANSEGISALLPIILLGQWNENVLGDLKLVEKLSGKTYADYTKMLQRFRLMPDSPIAHVGTIWRLKSPMDVMSYASVYITDGDLVELKEICRLLIADDDPDAEDKVTSDEWRMWQFKQQFSSDVKKGTYQSLILLSLINDENRNIWVDGLVRELLDNWTLQRFLSNRTYFTLLAEASPEAFLEFLEKTGKDIYDVIFTPQKSNVGLTGWNIYYTEILFALEMLAWDEDYIYRITSLLLHFSIYKNESNYANRPTNSLAEIFRFQLPQTFAKFENKIEVLTSLSSSFKIQICELCFRILDNLGAGAFSYTHFYKWRDFNAHTFPTYVSVPVDDVKAVTKLLLNCTTLSEDDTCALLKLSTKKWMSCCRTDILDAITKKKDTFGESGVVEHTLRDELAHHLSIPEAAWALSEKELEPYKKLLSDIESKDIVMKYRWMFEDMFLRLPQRKEMDYKEEFRIKQDIRNKAVEEILSERGKKGLWELVHIVKCPSSVVNSMIQLYGDGMLEDVCDKFCDKIVDLNFLQTFFQNLFFQKGEDDYAKVVDDVKTYDNTCLSVYLYAPGYNEKLAIIASDCGKEIETLYWQNIKVAYAETPNPTQIIDKLASVNRFDEALELIYHNKKSNQIPDILKVNVVKSLIFNGQRDFTPRFNWYYINSVMKDLDMSEDPEIVQALIQIEFFAYQAFEHLRNINELRLIKELMSKPEMLMELMVMAYKSDDGYEDKEVSESEINNRNVMARCSFHILYNLSCCPGVDNHGNVNSTILRTYIYRLYELSVEHHRTQVVDMVVGSLLGNLPRNDSYPQSVLGEIVEELKSDSVDEHIRIKIFNSRGVTTRAFAEGGDQERSLVALFKSYRDKVKFKYPRLAKIFSNLMQEYEHYANHEDCVAQLEDLEY
ncbi:MAG: hypothetical protein IJ280_05785 [Bacteroidales bacterium]|nr:hypothetical protein [Bacteroidales bacterium]